MSKVFLDTSYLLALELTRDQNHLAADQHWQSIVQHLPPLVTTSYVFNEVVTYFNSRRQHEKAIRVRGSLLLSPSVEFIHVDQSLFYQGWDYFQLHQDKDYSLADCISFIVMRQVGAETALTFDGHFTKAGFTKVP